MRRRDTGSRGRGIKVLALLMGLALIAAACGSDDDDDGGGAAVDEPTETTVEGEAGGDIVFAVEQEPTGLNWLEANDNAAWTAYIMQLVWAMPIFYEPDGTAGINEDFVDIELTGEDPQVVTYTMNPDAVWSDGTAITVDDWVYTWESQNCTQTTGTDPETGEPLYAYNAASCFGYEDIESIEEGDSSSEIVVSYSSPYADWISLFQPLFPAHKFLEAGNGDPVAGFNTGFKVETIADNLDLVVSGGPYIVTEYSPGEQMILERNEQWWGEPPLADRIILPFITDAAQQPSAMANGEIDVMFPQAQIDLVDQTAAIAGVESVVGFGTFWEHVDMNVENVHLGKLEVRQAIAKALDRDDIVERLPAQFDDSAEVLNNRIFFPADERYEANGADEYGEQDLEAARALLEGAGYVDDGGTYTHPTDGPLNLRITWRDPNPRREQTAQLVQSQLVEAGIGIDLAPQPDFLWLDSGNFDLGLFGWTGGKVPSSNDSIYRSDGGQNHAGLAIPEVDALFDEANIELDEETRSGLMNEIDVLLWEQLPTIPLFQVPEFLANVDTISNVVYNGYEGPAWNTFAWAVAN